LELDVKATGSAWCAYKNQTGEWIQVSSFQTVIWQGIKLRGRHDADMWVTAFKIGYSDDGQNFTYLVPSPELSDPGDKTVFRGSLDRGSIREVWFNMVETYPFVIRAKQIRIYPIKWN
jgi:hypothetical protein